MPDEMEERGVEEREEFDFHRLREILGRRHLYFLVPLLMGWLALWAAAWIIPSRYRSSTLILVEQAAMPKNYVVPNVNDDLQERMQSITQQILSRTRLLTIIDRFHLYETGKRQLTPEDKVEQMRKDIGIDLIRDAQTSSITAFRVSYRAPSPRLAQEIAGQLTSLFINENLAVRQEQSEQTTEFIRKQLGEAQQTLAIQEQKVRDFQLAHQGELPSQEAGNLQILAGVQQQLQTEQDALSAATQQRAYLQSMIQQQQAMQAGLAPAAGPATGVAAIDLELQALRSRLADLRSRYTDEHPDVQAVRAQIARTEKAREQYVAEAASGGGRARPGKAAGGAAGPLAQLEGQLEANRMEIANRQKTIAALKMRIDQYQGRLNREPAVEQQLAQLTRGYTQSKQIYDDLLKKESDSEMATNMEQMQQGEHFAMLDPPALPLKPEFPNRIKFCAIGFAVGFALGVGLVALLELLDDRLYGDKQIRRLLPVPVLAEIPEIVIPADAKRERWRTVRGWATAALVFGAMLAGSAYTYLRA